MSIHGGFRFLLRALIVCAILATPLYMGGCPYNDDNGKKDNLALAEEAFLNRDIGDAEMYYERYLRKNPEGEHRWGVWIKLLSIALDIRQDKKTAAEYLEIMLLEFSADAPKRREIQMHLAEIYKDVRSYAQAVTLWETLMADSGLPDEERAVVYRELSHAYLSRQEFTNAVEVLDLCLELDVHENTKADCLYAMAETRTLTNELEESERALRDLLALPDASQNRLVLATFSLADVLERQERFQEAVELFESIRESYPNTRVVEIRLGTLKSKLGSDKNKQ